MAETDEKGRDSTKDPAFQRVVQTFLNTPPKSHKAEKAEKPAKRKGAAKDRP